MRTYPKRDTQKAVRDSLRFLDIASGKRTPNVYSDIYEPDKAALNELLLKPDEYEQGIAAIVKERRV